MKGLRKSGQAGAGLIEVMIAVLLLAIGVIGIGAMHLASMRRSQVTFERTQAVVLTAMIADSMRANRPAAVGGEYNTAGELCAVPVTKSKSVAQVDLAAWISAIKKETVDLDDTCGQVHCAQSQCQVAVTWNVSRVAQGDAPGMLRERYQVGVSL